MGWSAFYWPKAQPSGPTALGLGFRSVKYVGGIGSQTPSCSVVPVLIMFTCTYPWLLLMWWVWKYWNRVPHMHSDSTGSSHKNLTNLRYGACIKRAKGSQKSEVKQTKTNYWQYMYPKGKTTGSYAGCQNYVFVRRSHERFIYFKYYPSHHTNYSLLAFHHPPSL